LCNGVYALHCPAAINKVSVIVEIRFGQTWLNKSLSFHCLIYVSLK